MRSPPEYLWIALGDFEAKSKVEKLETLTNALDALMQSGRRATWRSPTNRKKKKLK